MKFVQVVIAFTIFLTARVSKSRCDLTNKCIGDLPHAVIDDLLTILKCGAAAPLGICASTKDISKLSYWLYTRNNPSDATVISSTDQIDASKPIIILIHGWLGNADSDYIRAIKNAYLDRYDCNIISLNYEDYANKEYQTTFCYIPPIAANFANFICDLNKSLNISTKTLHIVGHSLGGHIAGIAGKQTQKTCGRIGRITGMDPAGPLFQDLNKDLRLDKTDASFVDIIHTNQGQFGYNGNCGHVDFYPNCGYFQPGCPLTALNETVTSKDISKFPLKYVSCHHKRSCFYFAESISNNDFFATSCEFCGLPSCYKAIHERSQTYMGESCRSKPESEQYTLATAGQPMFGLGPRGPLD